MNRLAASLVLSVTTLIAAACTAAAPTAVPSASPAGPSAPASDEPGGSPAAEVRISARDIRFDTAELDVSAGTAFTIAFDNPDVAPHNVAIYRPDGTKVFAGDVIEGGRSITYQVPPIAAGTYSFRCDVHPDMKGVVVAR